MRILPVMSYAKKLYMVCGTGILTILYYNLLQKTILIWKSAPKGSKPYDL